MNNDYFIEDLSSSEDVDYFTYSTSKQSVLVNRDDDSPPAILAFSITSGRETWGHSPHLGALCPMQEEGSSDGSVEEWMILDQAQEEGDSNIQLNLSFSISSDEDTNPEDKNATQFQDQWAVSKRDKDSGGVSSTCRYFMPDQSLFCPVCKRTGHLAKSCQLQKKYPTCVLCGIQGHLQKECPSRPCSRCGLMSHGFSACNRLPVWNQHCQRCGLMGHLSDLCPDTWRQYHYTTTMMESPVRIQTFRAIKQKKRLAYCYNCSKRGHYGHECSLKRMISGTFFTLPYVYHYDTSTTEKILQSRTRNRKIETANETFEQQESIETLGEKDKYLLFQRKTKIKQKAQASGRKTWPERRRERQEIKRLRREAQARREGGLLGQCRHKPDDDILYLDPFGDNNPWHYMSPSKKAYKSLHQINKNSRKTQKEPLKRRGQKNHDYLHPSKEVDIDSKELLSPKQRVRHRRR